MKYAICFFPTVGILCGGALFLWGRISLFLGLSGILFAAVAVSLPLFITGGIHMDGYMDTVDALASHQSRERKLEILKDPHCGAFAVLYCGVYLLLYFALFWEIYAAGLVDVCCPIFTFSRSLCALCVLTMPNARGSGMLFSFTRDTEKAKIAAVMAVVALLAGIAMLRLSFFPGGMGILLGFVAMIYYRFMAKKQFGGVTGDTSGFFLQICELMTTAGIWMGGKLL